MEKLTLIEDLSQSVGMLKSLKAKNSKLYIWQHPEGGDRFGFDIDAEDLVITKKFMLFGDHRLLKMKENEDLFFYYEPLMLIFKAKVIKKGPGHLFLGKPEKVQIKDTRKESRLPITDKEISVNISKKIINSAAARFKFRLFDISEGGISFLIDPYHGLSFFVGEELKIHSINHFILTPLIGGRVIYLQPFRWNGEDRVKMGLEFKRKLSMSEIKSMTN